MIRTTIILSPKQIAKRAKAKGMTIEAFTAMFRKQNHANVIPNPNQAHRFQAKVKGRRGEKPKTATVT